MFLVIIDRVDENTVFIHFVGMPIYDALRSKISRSAHGEKSDPECENGPNGFELNAALFWASGTQWY